MDRIPIGKTDHQAPTFVELKQKRTDLIYCNSEVSKNSSLFKRKLFLQDCKIASRLQLILTVPSCLIHYLSLQDKCRCKADKVIALEYVISVKWQEQKYDTLWRCLRISLGKIQQSFTYPTDSGAAPKCLRSLQGLPFSVFTVLTFRAFTLEPLFLHILPIRQKRS